MTQVPEPRPPWPRSTALLSLLVLVSVGVGAAVALWMRPKVPASATSISLPAKPSAAPPPELALDHLLNAWLEAGRAGDARASGRLDTIVWHLRRGGDGGRIVEDFVRDASVPPALQLAVAEHLGGDCAHPVEALARPALLGSDPASAGEAASLLLRRGCCVRATGHTLRATVALCASAPAPHPPLLLALARGTGLRWAPEMVDGSLVLGLLEQDGGSPLLLHPLDAGIPSPPLRLDSAAASALALPLSVAPRQ